jgi:hypothetical protein
VNVTIPNEVADVIEDMRKQRTCPPLTNEMIAAIYMNRVYNGPTARTLRTTTFETLMAALINGYEREQTAEQRAHSNIRDAYVTTQQRAKLARARGRTGMTFDAYADGIQFTLDTLGVKVAGVNG